MHAFFWGRHPLISSEKYNLTHTHTLYNTIYIYTLWMMPSQFFTDRKSRKIWMAMGCAAWFVAWPRGSIRPLRGGRFLRRKMRRLGGGRIVLDAGHSRKNLIYFLRNLSTFLQVWVGLKIIDWKSEPIWICDQLNFPETDFVLVLFNSFWACHMREFDIGGRLAHLPRNVSKPHPNILR